LLLNPLEHRDLMDITGYAFVSGGGSGIGRACCIAFATDGAAGVLVTDISIEAAQKVASEARAAASNPNIQVGAMQVDVTAEKSVTRAMEHMVRTFGRIDYCVNCAGIGVQNAKEIADIDINEFNHFMNVNVTGTLLVTSVASRLMRSQEPVPISHRSSGRGVTRGTIVNIGSAASYVASPDITQYTTSKHAVLGLTKNAGESIFPLGSKK
jgi:NAD(P)-dependent dehydrogenase (short-subunit alcohol dehydrogenase family)